LFSEYTDSRIERFGVPHLSAGVAVREDTPSSSGPSLSEGEGRGEEWSGEGEEEMLPSNSACLFCRETIWASVAAISLSTASILNRSCSLVSGRDPEEEGAGGGGEEGSYGG
jgi:hypothetical protein